MEKLELRILTVECEVLRIFFEGTYVLDREAAHKKMIFTITKNSQKMIDYLRIFDCFNGAYVLQGNSLIAFGNFIFQDNQSFSIEETINFTFFMNESKELIVEF